MAHHRTSKTETELHYSEVRKIFSKTAMQLGLSDPYAGIFGQSVWHLCNRGYPGIANSIAFLMINKDVLKEVWSNPRYPHQNDPLSLICPIRTAVLVEQKIDIAEENGNLEDFSLTLGRSALPVLSLPPIAFSLKQRICDFNTVQILGPSATISMSDAGMSEVADTLSHEFAWVGNKHDVEKPVTYKLSRDAFSEDGLFHRKVRRETLRLPTIRLSDDGTLRL